jgi:hypothetical protein
MSIEAGILGIDPLAPQIISTTDGGRGWCLKFNLRAFQQVIGF